MKDKNLQEGLKKRKKRAASKNDTDTEPDEFIAPNADTDLPLDGHVANDAVLRGEDHADDKIRPEQDNNNERGTPQKDAGML